MGPSEAPLGDIVLRTWPGPLNYKPIGRPSGQGSINTGIVIPILEDLLGPLSYRMSLLKEYLKLRRTTSFKSHIFLTQSNIDLSFFVADNTLHLLRFSVLIS